MQLCVVSSSVRNAPVVLWMCLRRTGSKVSLVEIAARFEYCFMLVFLGMSRVVISLFFFFSSRRRHTRLQGDWSSDVCSSDLVELLAVAREDGTRAVHGRDLPLAAALRERLDEDLVDARLVRRVGDGAVVGRSEERSCRERV